MGKQTKVGIICILGIILIIILGFYASTNKRNREGITSTDGHETRALVGLDAYLEEQDTIMEEMMEDMMDLPKSGSAAVNFLNGMIPHHRSAVDMSESYIKNGGKNEDLKKLAEAIITQQNEEIEQMKSMAEALLKGGTKDEEAEAAYLEEYNEMMHNAHSGNTIATNIEGAFTEGMIMHHQMAIDMANAILNHTDGEIDKDVRTLAQNIIELQEKEIAQMNEIQKKMSENPSIK